MQTRCFVEKIRSKKSVKDENARMEVHAQIDMIRRKKKEGQITILIHNNGRLRCKYTPMNYLSTNYQYAWEKKQELFMFRTIVLFWAPRPPFLFYLAPPRKKWPKMIRTGFEPTTRSFRCMSTYLCATAPIYWIFVLICIHIAVPPTIFAFYKFGVMGTP